MVPSFQFYRLSATSSVTATTISPYFGASSNVTLVSGSVYEAEFNLYFTKTTAGTVTFTLASSAAPVILNAYYVGTVIGGATPVGAAQTAALIGSVATAAALPATGSLVTAVTHEFVIKAFIETNLTTSGTLGFFITNSAGSVTPRQGSYFKVTRLSTSNVGIFT